MTELLAATTITAPVTAQIGPTVTFNARPKNLAIQGKFTFGSGGTNATVWIQTSLDGGLTWVDVCCLQFLVASLRVIANLSANTPKTTPATATDGSLTANTSVDGILGNKFRTKLTTTGTYAGGTTLAVDIAQDQV
jgi:hypothetical protein